MHSSRRIYPINHLAFYPSLHPVDYLSSNCPALHVEYLDSGRKFMIGRVGSLRIYCMRGTRKMIDIMMDLKAVPKPLGPGTVHKGFYDRMNMILSQFPLDNTVTRVLMTGHSLGGGAAHCGYLILKTLYPSMPVVCVTFGVPCCVSPEIMMAIEEPREIVNFIDEGDYIPSITIDKYTSEKRTKS